MDVLDIVSVQRGCVYDGPGVRTTVFLKGCSCHCPWCCNPESISSKIDEYFVDESKCLLNSGVHSAICKDCSRIGGGRMIYECPFSVAIPVSRQITVEELHKEIMKDKSLFQLSGGGVTFSGGEPLLQSDILKLIMPIIKQEEISIAMETTLMASEEQIMQLAHYVDYWIVDLKLQPEMYLHDNCYIKRIQKSLKMLRKNANILFRVVFVKSMKSEFNNIVNLLKLLNVSSIELLQCHNLGKNKYRKLLIPFHDYSVERKDLEMFACHLENKGIQVNKVLI